MSKTSLIIWGTLFSLNLLTMCAVNLSVLTLPLLSFYLLCFSCTFLSKQNEHFFAAPLGGDICHHQLPCLPPGSACGITGTAANTTKKVNESTSGHTSASSTILLPSGQMTWSTWERTLSQVSSGVLRLACRGQSHNNTDNYCWVFFGNCFNYILFVKTSLYRYTVCSFCF